jgi:hypothetical protein
MNIFRILLASVATLLFAGTGMLANADLIVIDQPKQLEIERPDFTRLPGFHTLPDFSISDVVKEFISTSSTGTYYRYYVTISNLGGPCTDCQIKVKAVTRYAYSDHGTMASEYDVITAPNGDQSVFTTFLVNEDKLSGNEYPDLFIITFTVDADEDYLELDEENNQWYCDDFIAPCDGCVRDDCP